MSDRAKKITELTVTASVANGDLFIIGKVAANTTNTVTANSLFTYFSNKATSFVQNTDSRTLSGNLVFSAQGINFTGKATVSGNLVISSGASLIDSTGNQGANGQILTTNGSSNVYWSSPKMPLGTKLSNDSGNPGDFSYDGSYIYVCVSANVWKRATLNAY